MRLRFGFAAIQALSDEVKRSVTFDSALSHIPKLVRFAQFAGPKPHTEVYVCSGRSEISLVALSSNGGATQALARPRGHDFGSGVHISRYAYVQCCISTGHIVLSLSRSCTQPLDICAVIYYG